MELFDSIYEQVRELNSQIPYCQELQRECNHVANLSRPHPLIEYLMRPSPIVELLMQANPLIEAMQERQSDVAEQSSIFQRASDEATMMNKLQEKYAAQERRHQQLEDMCRIPFSLQKSFDYQPPNVSPSPEPVAEIEPEDLPKKPIGFHTEWLD